MREVDLSKKPGNTFLRKINVSLVGSLGQNYLGPYAVCLKFQVQLFFRGSLDKFTKY